MIIVNLKGGLGNQMFQYALGRTLALKNNVTLKLDTHSLSKAVELGNIYRPFDLEAFSIQKDIATKDEIGRLKYPHGLISKISEIFKHKVLRQFHIIFDPKILSLTGNQYLDGYWQSPLYFADIRETLLLDFTLLEPLSNSGQALLNKIQNSNSIAIHFRRGDYIKNELVRREYGICSVAYYQNAIKKIEQTQKNTVYFIFSDDIAWVKNNLQLGDNTVHYIEDTTLTSPQELYLMSQCQHNIIANSSFSWWGAWLNQNPNRIIIAPTPWFDTAPYDKDLLPSTWIKLPK